MKGAGRSVRGIAEDLGIARNTVCRYLKSPEAIRAKPRPQRASKLDPYTGYVDRRLDEGLENRVVPHRELRARGGANAVLDRNLAVDQAAEVLEVNSRVAEKLPRAGFLPQCGF